MPEKIHKFRVICREFQSVSGGVGLLDAVLPPLLFLVFNGLAGFQAAMIGSLILGILISILRLARRQSLKFALGGLGSVGLAVAIAYGLGRAEGYFLPVIVNGGITIALALISLIIRKPMVAWTSFLARRWPLDWYWHARVRPAYTEVTVAWMLFFVFRLYWQVILFNGNDVNRLAVVNALTGWPATILLLVLSYLYGTWRLARLGGPSVEEFRNRALPPWSGQQQGF